MQFSKATLLSLLAAIAYTDSIPEEVAKIPPCAIACLNNAVAKSGCGATDYLCQCTTGREGILADATPCISTACSPNDLQLAGSAANEICALATAGGSSSAAGGSATAAATSVPATTTPNSAGSSLKAGAAVVGAAALAALAL